MKQSSSGEIASPLRVSYTVLMRSRIAEKNPAAVALGRLGGLKGGTARAKSLSAKRRKEIAQKAVRARWAKK